MSDGQSPRFFSFGCSFTNYRWPTWADIMAANFEHHENWGKVGAGNYFIANSIIECDLKNKITSHDIVAIMWSSVARLDSYKNQAWQTPGNIYNQKYYSLPVVQALADDRGFYIRDLCAIYSTQRLLDSIGCQWFMFCMTDITRPSEWDNHDVSSDVQDILDFFRPTLIKIKPSIHQVIFNYDWFSRPFVGKKLHDLQKHYQEVAGPDWPPLETVVKDQRPHLTDQNVWDEIFDLSKWDWKKLFHEHQREDSHPTPLEHLEYIKRVVPDWSISSETYSILAEIDNLIRTDQPIKPELMIQIKKSQPVKRW